MTSPIMPECFVPQILVAEDVVRARHRRLEPHRREPAGHGVHLHAEGRDAVVVNDVLGSERDAHGAADRHVHLVDFAHALGCCTFHIHCLPTT